MLDKIPFNLHSMQGKELVYVHEAIRSGSLAGDGKFTKLVQNWFSDYIPSHTSLLVPSCTAALELAALILDIGPGDEVILPSFTFVSTANAFLLRGAKLVFADVDPVSLCISTESLLSCLSPRTKAVVAVHYAGTSHNIDELAELCRLRRIYLIEDAAQALCSSYKGQPLGSFGDISCFSFHETKNIACGEAGMILIRDSALFQRAEVVREKGTNRQQFLRGDIDKYTWEDIGSSFLVGELSAAYLLAQLEAAWAITEARHDIWNSYDSYFSSVFCSDQLQLPFRSQHVHLNAHIFYLLMPTPDVTNAFRRKLLDYGISAPFHYVPLHDSPYGRKLLGLTPSLPVTESIAQRLVRLPVWPGLTPHLPRIFSAVDSVLSSVFSAPF